MTEYIFLKGDAFINTSPVYWEHGNWYNALIQACNVLFPGSVKMDNDRWAIKIKSKVCLTLSCSSNEGKVYVRTTQEPYQQDLKLRDQDYSFRFFSYRETLGFLFKMKEVEIYINENEG